MQMNELMMKCAIRHRATIAQLCALPIFLFSNCRSISSRKSLVQNARSSPTQISISPEFFPISGPTDPIIQNRTITRNYYFGAEALNQALFKPISHQSFNANWLHYGIWGSLRAGESIDGTDLQSAFSVKDLAFESLTGALNWLPAGVADEYIKGLRDDNRILTTLIKIIQRSIADGNRRVADEVLGLTDRFIRRLGCDEELNEENLQDFMTSLEFQFPRNASMETIWSGLLAEIPNLSAGKRHTGGQDALARAYETYYRAKFEQDPMIQTQMMHYGNLMIAIHEQFVLQTYISGALGILDPASPLFRKVATLLSMDVGVPAPGFKGILRPGEGMSRTALRTGFPASGFIPSLKKYTWAPLIELARITELDKYSGLGSSDWTNYKSRIYLISGMMQTFHNYKLLGAFPYAGPHQSVSLICQK